MTRWPTERIGTGVPGLDRVLEGGLLRGAAYIVHGPPGAGKTVLANQVAHHHAVEGGKVLYVTLLAESHDRMLQHMSGFSFFDRHRIPSQLYYLSAFHTLADGGVDGVLRMVRHELRRHGADFLVLDGLFVLREAAQDDRDFRRFVHELQGLLAGAGVTAFLLTNESRAPSAPEHTMVDGWIELFHDLVGPQAVRSMVVRKQRGSSFLDGRHRFRIGGGGMTVFPRLESLPVGEVAPDVPRARLSTGIAALDALLAGGLPDASATLVKGPTGSGKTTFALHFLSDASAAEPGLWFGLAERPERLASKAAGLGMDLDELQRTGAVSVAWCPSREIILDEIATKILNQTQATGARRIVLDSLTTMINASTEPERIINFVASLSDHVRALGAGILYTLERPELFAPSQLGAYDLPALVDNIVVLHYEKMHEALERRLSIMKLRDSHLEMRPHPFVIAERGLVLEPGASGNGSPPEGP